MGYWRELREVLEKGVHIAADGLKESAEGAVVKTKEGITAVKLTKDLRGKRKELEETLTELGDAVYDLYKEKKDIYKDKNIKTIITAVEEKEKECKQIEKKLKNSTDKD